MMKLALSLLALVVLLLASAYAQAPQHSVDLAWVDTSNPSGTTYSVYRVTGLCSGAPVFNKLITGVATKTYTDTTVTPGNYCYQVTASFNGVESAPSPTALASVPSFPPQSLTVTVK